MTGELLESIHNHFILLREHHTCSIMMKKKSILSVDARSALVLAQYLAEHLAGKYKRFFGVHMCVVMCCTRCVVSVKSRHVLCLALSCEV